jgi:hypothetical protein
MYKNREVWTASRDSRGVTERRHVLLPALAWASVLTLDAVLAMRDPDPGAGGGHGCGRPQ